MTQWLLGLFGLADTCTIDEHDFRLVKQNEYAKHYKCEKCGLIGWA